VLGTTNSYSKGTLVRRRPQHLVLLDYAVRRERMFVLKQPGGKGLTREFIVIHLP